MSEIVEDDQVAASFATARETVRLGDVIEVIRGASPRPKGDPRYFGGDIPWISISDITREPGKFLSRTREFVTVAGAEKSRLLPAGTLILSNSGTVCVPKILAVDGCIHDGFVAFPNLSAAFDKTYLYWFFEYIRPSIIEANRQGITQVNLNTGIVREIRLPNDSLKRQREIVAEIEKQFSRLDEAVANLQRVKANLKRYKASVLKDAVEGRLVPTEAELARREGRSFETGEQLMQRILAARRSQWKGKSKFKEPVAPDAGVLRALPAGWTWATYAQVGEVTTGFTPPTGDVGNFGGNIPFFKPSDLDVGENVTVAREYLSEKGIGKGRLLKANSVLVTCIGATIGKTGLAAVDCATNQQINAVSPSDRGAVPLFIYHWTVSLTGQTQILDNSSATTLPILNKSKFEALSVPLPPGAEQLRIVAEVDRRLSLVRGVEREVDANLKRAKALRASTLATAFSDQRIA